MCLTWLEVEAGGGRPPPWPGAGSRAGTRPGAAPAAGAGPALQELAPGERGGKEVGISGHGESSFSECEWVGWIGRAGALRVRVSGWRGGAGRHGSTGGGGRDGEAGHDAHLVVRGVGDVDVLGAGVHRHGKGRVEIGRGRRPAVAAAALLPRRVDQRRDGPGRCHLADGVVEGVGDEEVARLVERNALRAVQAGLGRRPPVTAEAAEATRGLVGRDIAGHGGDDPLVETRRITLLPESAM